MTQSYPVFVEETFVRLVWVEASDAEHARRRAQETPSEYTSKIEIWDSWAAVSSPKSEQDWDNVYGWAGAAEEQDNHVQLHRAMLWRRELEAKQAACHEARHPDTDVYPSGSIWCRGCTDYLYIADGAR